MTSMFVPKGIAQVRVPRGVVCPVGVADVGTEVAAAAGGLAGALDVQAVSTPLPADAPIPSTTRLTKERRDSKCRWCLRTTSGRAENSMARLLLLEST